MQKRLARCVVMVLVLWAAVGCSGRGSDNADPLRGVGDETAARLCKGFFADADAARNAGNTVSLDGFDAAVSGFESRAKEAREVGAREFAAELADAAGAARALAQGSRSALASGVSGSVPDEPAPEAAVLAMFARLQLPETQISLACYTRGFTRFSP